MKLILSRKGVDSSSGGFASPVFSDGRLMSIAIPDKRARLRYSDIASDAGTDINVGRIVKQLSGSRLGSRDFVHLDPDLDSRQLTRPEEWLPLFGQCGAAQSHLASHNVGRGDIFLFFGWFRKAEFHRRRWRYVKGAPDQHVIYGWMQVQSVVPVVSIQSSKKLHWMRYHPHCHGEFSGSNIIYCASRTLQLSGVNNKRGAGVFSYYHQKRCLTSDGCSRSVWKLPGWMHPAGRRSALSYHSDIRRWRSVDSVVELKSATRGQEFVLDLDHYPEGKSWLASLLQS